MPVELQGVTDIVDIKTAVEFIPDSHDQYGISDIDATGDPEYYGFLDKDGNWIIMENTGGTDYRYAKGTSDYAANWVNRATLSYDYYAMEF